MEADEATDTLNGSGIFAAARALEPQQNPTLRNPFVITSSTLPDGQKTNTPTSSS